MAIYPVPSHRPNGRRQVSQIIGGLTPTEAAASPGGIGALLSHHRSRMIGGGFVLSSLLIGLMVVSTGIAL